MSAIPNLPIDAPGLQSNGVTNGTTKTPFRLNDTPVENLRKLKVIVIGAGYSGIYCGIRIPERLRNVELVIYEKNAGVGGTWYENR
jgi:ribulose 1,5-bisphosphate synthetase/thiazole synthase